MPRIDRATSHIVSRSRSFTGLIKLTVIINTPLETNCKWTQEALSLPRRMESGRLTRRYVPCGGDGLLESWIHTDQPAITASAAGAGSLPTRA